MSDALHTEPSAGRTGNRPPAPGEEPPATGLPPGLRVLSRALAELPVGSGQHRIVRRVYESRLRERPDPRVRVRLRSGAVMTLDLSDYTQAQAALTRRYDPALLAFIRSRLPAGGTLVDVGAHIGFVVIAIARARPDVRVVALEPHPGNVDRLLGNVALNPGVEVEIEPVAAGRVPGQAMLSDEAGEGTDYHRIVAPGSNGSIEIGVETLDRLAGERGIDRIDVLKLDVEGHEPEALAGAAELLADRRVGVVICELRDSLLGRFDSSSAGLVAGLRELGYRPEEIPPVGLHRFHAPSVPYENCAFVPEAPAISAAS